MDQRPDLNKKISTKDFTEFYWLKSELVEFCVKVGLRTTGSKLEVTERIETYLDTGNKDEKRLKDESKSESKFDWKNSDLSLNTIITDNYINTENVRSFFKKQIGIHFKFNVKFMKWMKANRGKTLGMAVEEWKRIDTEKKTETQPKEIAPQFEYNRFMRDFLADNPNMERATGIKLWKIKKSMRGDNVYTREDLNWISDELKEGKLL